MPPQKPAPRETQEQSIKARKNLYFDEKKKQPDATPGLPTKKARKTFRDYLRETPAAPLSTRTKAILWGVGALVALLLVATLLHSNSAKPGRPDRRRGRRPRKEAAVVAPPIEYALPFRIDHPMG